MRRHRLGAFLYVLEIVTFDRSAELNTLTGMLVDGRITDLRWPSNWDGGRLGRSFAGTEWTVVHAPTAQESAESAEFGGSVVRCALSRWSPRRMVGVYSFVIGRDLSQLC